MDDDRDGCDDDDLFSDLASNTIINLNSDDLSEESTRLRSFEIWPENAPVAKQKLAKAGFYTTGKDYIVKCYSCKWEVKDWGYVNQVIQKHSIINPNCEFLKENSMIRGNIGNQTTATSSEISQLSLETNSDDEICNGNDVVGNTFSSISRDIPPPIWNSRNRDNKIWYTFESLKEESERLKTFKNWPSPFVLPEALAKAGFFYLKDNDKVQCVYCRGIIGEWVVGDVPMTEHSKHFPTCPFVKGRNVGNIPIENEDDAFGPSLFHPHHEEEQYTRLINFQKLSKPEKGYITTTELEEMGVVTRYKGPKHPNYVTKESRLRSFACWPKIFHQKPEDLADSGFYYAGVSDHVKCFYCDGGLKNWEPVNEPWIEHAKYFSTCEFVILKKGKEFIKMAIQEESPPVFSISDEFDVEPSSSESISQPIPVTLSCSNSVSTVVSTVEDLESKTKDLSLEDKKQDMHLCKICMDEEIKIVFFPCGHLITCPTCAPSLHKCPICRQKICGTMRVFLS